VGSPRYSGVTPVLLPCNAVNLLRSMHMWFNPRETGCRGVQSTPNRRPPAPASVVKTLSRSRAERAAAAYTFGSDRSSHICHYAVRDRTQARASGLVFQQEPDPEIGRETAATAGSFGAYLRNSDSSSPLRLMMDLGVPAGISRRLGTGTVAVSAPGNSLR
jgi:hypothetical protein